VNAHPDHRHLTSYGLAIIPFHFLCRALHLGKSLFVVGIFLNQVKKVITHRLQIVTQGTRPTIWEIIFTEDRLSRTGPVREVIGN
jgi:hypothetical protein